MEHFVPAVMHNMDGYAGVVNGDADNVLLSTILKEVRELKEIVERSEETIKSQLKCLTDEVAALRSEVINLRNPEMHDIDTSVLPNLPFMSFDDFKEFDTMLLAEDELRTQLKYTIIRVGGKDFPSFLRNALKTIISDELAVNLTWRGTPDKPSIKLFTCFKLIKDVCLSRYAHATEMELNRIAQQHFLHAKDRIMKRRKVEV